MKILTLIFAVYLLALPCIACADNNVCNDNIQSYSSAQTDDHSGHEEKTDDCGSFCTCSCCVHIVSVNYQPVKIEIAVPVALNRNNILYDNISLPSNYFGNIWQPPRAG